MKILVYCTGFIGDILFASSLAKKLKEQYPDSFITYYIPLPQPKILLEQNPAIYEVITDWNRTKQHWDKRIDIPTVNPEFPATIQMQAAGGIENQSLDFDVHTVKTYDDFAKLKMREGCPNVAYLVDWAWRAYQCTPETLALGIGAPHRNTEAVIQTLRNTTNYNLIPVGFDRLHPSTHRDTQNPEKYAQAASVIKACNWFIGAEGGLSNLAAAVGTKCIITTDFIIQNYGPNGRLRKIENPQMGPAVYYPNAGHVHLDPCIADVEIANRIISIIG